MEKKEGTRILYVDDTRTNLVIAKGILSKAGFQVFLAEDGKQGLEMADQLQPDLILLDVMMPGMSGFEVCAALQKNEQTAYVPVVFMTALTEERDRTQAFSVGAVDYLTKPIDPGRLLETVRKHLETRAKWQKAVQREETHRKKGLFGFILHLGETLDLPREKTQLLQSIHPRKAYSIASSIGISEAELARSISAYSGLEYMPEIPHSRIQLGVLPLPFCSYNLIVPIDATSGGTAYVITNPFDYELFEDLRSIVAVADQAPFLITEPDTIRAILGKGISANSQETKERKRQFATPKVNLNDILKSLELEHKESVGENDRDADKEEVLSESSSTIIKLANHIIWDAYLKGASDIHIEPYPDKKNCIVRYRIDGTCYKMLEIPPTQSHPLVSRYKIMARLDIAEKRKPQDGKIALKGPEGKIEVRAATLPTVGGQEDIVMRVFPSGDPTPMENMNFTERNLKELKRIIQSPYGLILCVGPTGSGKTTTLHSCLSFLNQADRKIWTAEDPVEIQQRGLRQVQVAPKIGLTFAVAMRAFLRADPDIIMVGEMRDAETAKMGIEASLTGHLVLSTLHTNNAPETIIRFLEMGMEPYSFADALRGILAQRLCRRLCDKCKRATQASSEKHGEIAELFGKERFHEVRNEFPTPLVLFEPVGCEVCQSSGYKGRVALHELLTATEEVKRMIIQKEQVEDIRSAARSQGMETLLQDGIRKVLAGQADLSSVLSVCLA